LQLLLTPALQLAFACVKIWNPRSYVCSDVRVAVAQQPALLVAALLVVQVDPKACFANFESSKSCHPASGI